MRKYSVLVAALALSGCAHGFDRGALTARLQDEAV
jgi:hypothetical protein